MDTQFQRAKIEAIVGPELLEPFQNFISDYSSTSEEKQLHLESCAFFLYELLINTRNYDDDLCSWHKLSVSTQSTIKCVLLDLISLEESEFIVRKLCHITCKLAQLLLPDNSWPALLPFLFQCVGNHSRSNNYLVVKESAFFILSILPNNIGEKILVPCVTDLYSPFQTTLNDYTLDLQVRFPAMMAVIAFIQCVPSSNEKESFRDLLPGVIRTLADTFRSSEEAAHRALKHFIQLANDEPRSSSMQLADVVATVFDTGDATIIRCLKDLHPLFRNILYDDTLDLDMRISVMAAVISFIQRVPSPNEKERFQDILPGMTGTLTNALSSGGKAEDVLKLFIELARNEPTFFRTQLVVVVGTMLDIAEDESWEEGIRHLALEFSITLVEAKEKAPGMMKRLPLFISRCYAILLKLLQDNVKDARPDWHSAELMNDNQGQNRSFFVALHYLERFSRALGRNSVAHIVKDHLCAYLATREWKKRFSALAALKYISEDRSKVMIKYQDQVMQMVLNCLQDPHPQVRDLACLTNFGWWMAFPRNIQEKYHNKVILALIAAMDDFHPQVQVAAMTNICQFLALDRPETLIPYLDGIVNKLLVLVQNDKHLVQREALAAMAAVAFCVQEQFRIYYDTVMPHMRTFLRNTDPEANLFLRTIAMVCISQVGVGVGKETFKDDAKQLLLQVMEVFTSLQGPEVKVDEHTTSLMLCVCARVCTCIGKDFLPYMSTIMPIAVQHAQLEPAMTISPKSMYYQMHALEYWGNAEDFARPDVLLVKVRACTSLFLFAYALEEDFYPWIPQVVSVFVPLLKFYSDKKIRLFAIGALCALLNSDQLAVKKGTAQGGSLSDYTIQCLVEALHEEPLADYCAHILESLNDCLEMCQPLVHERQLRGIVDEVKHVITESLNRKRKLKERAKLEDFDAEEEEMLREEKEHEDEILIQLCGILRTLIESLKAAFLPSFEELSSYLIPMWGQDRTAQERCTPVDIFASLVRECPEAALKYSDAFLPLLLDAINDESPAVRKNALYAIGHYAEHGGSVFKPFVSEVISRIHVVTTHISAREPENEHAYHKAVSALGKICQFHRESIDSAKIIPAWLNCLPIEGDTVEAKVVHDQLCSMFKRSGTEILGSKYEHFPKVISVFAEVICAREDLATKGTSKCMINLLRHFQQTVPSATWESAWSLLLPQQEMELASILSPEQDVML